MEIVWTFANLIIPIFKQPAIAIIARYTRPIQEIFHTNNLDKVVITLVVVIFVLSIPVEYLEPEINSYMDAIWWAIVTATTVGYGDISPVTPVGRIIAVFLMIFGIGLIGIVTSAVASYFTRGREESKDPTIHFISEQVKRLDELTPLEKVYFHACLRIVLNFNIWIRI